MLGVQPVPFGKVIETTTEPPEVFLFDQYPSSPKYGFALERLSSTYNDVIIRVVRSTDFVEQDFYLVGNIVSQTQLENFVTNFGANPTADGHVILWRSQVGNKVVEFKGGTVLQVTPKIVENGNLVIREGKIAMKFNGNDVLEDDTGDFNYMTNYSGVVVYAHNAQGVTASPWTDGSISGGNRVDIFDNGSQVCHVGVYASGGNFVLHNCTYPGPLFDIGPLLTVTHAIVPSGGSSGITAQADNIDMTTAGGFGNAPLTNIGRYLRAGYQLDGYLCLAVAWDHNYGASLDGIRDFLSF